MRTLRDLYKGWKQKREFKRYYRELSDPKTVKMLIVKMYGETFSPDDFTVDNGKIFQESKLIGYYRFDENGYFIVEPIKEDTDGSETDRSES